MNGDDLGLIDLHLHALPGLDDGVRTLSDSIDMLQGLVGFGFTHLVTTPHRDFCRWKYSDSQCDKAYRQVQHGLVEHGVNLELRLGAEYTYGPQFQNEVAKKEARTIAGTNCILLELPEKQMPDTVVSALFQTNLLGYEVILAHPERCRAFHNNCHALERLASGRAMVQVSFRSLAGTFGRTIKRTAWTLVEEGIADLVATDCHSPKELKKIVKPVLAELHNRLPPHRLRSLMTDFPAGLLGLGR